MPLYGDGLNVRGWIHADDHCRGMVVPVTDRKGHGRRYSLDDSLLRSMGYAPRVPFTEGLKATVEWYAGNRDWWEHLHRPMPPARGRL